MTKNNDKKSGRIYTPKYIVKNILDLSGYFGEEILQKHIIDNSCGDGAFLTEIIERYCNIAIEHSINIKILKTELETYIHGIDYDKEECLKCKNNLDVVAEKYNIYNVNWDIICSDSLKENRYNNMMSYVVGNPPYVRVHNLGDSYDEIKNFSFAQNGMTDLFIAFFEIGLKMLNENGVLGYITPSSYFSSLAGKTLRKYLIDNNLIEKMVNLKHFQPFNATTYTAISILRKNRLNKDLEYYEFDEKKLVPSYVDSIRNHCYYISNNFYFGNTDELALISDIFYNLGHCDIEVKNGYATLCDDVFINDFSFESEYILPIIKASTGEIKKMFYPYDKNSNLISEEVIESNHDLYDYLSDNKALLLKRSNEKDNKKYWYAFGRSQALKDTYKQKLSINSLLRNTDDWKMVDAPAGVGVYSGLYIVSEHIPMEAIKASLKCHDFIDYISLVGKYKSGGYYTFSTRDVKAYLNYKFSYEKGLLNYE